MKAKRRWRAPKAKPGQLIACYGKVDGDLDVCFASGGSGATSADSHLIHSMFGGLEHRKYGRFPADHDGYLKELEARGYDLTTIKFSIQQKAKPEAKPRTDHAFTTHPAYTGAGCAVCGKAEALHVDPAVSRG